MFVTFYRTLFQEIIQLQIQYNLYLFQSKNDALKIPSMITLLAFSYISIIILIDTIQSKAYLNKNKNKTNTLNCV